MPVDTLLNVEIVQTVLGPHNKNTKISAENYHRYSSISQSHRSRTGSELKSMEFSDPQISPGET